VETRFVFDRASSK